GAGRGRVRLARTPRRAGTPDTAVGARRGPRTQRRHRGRPRRAAHGQRSARDVQVSGPFARWQHTHRVDADGPAACYLEDRIEYALPLGAVGALAGGTLVRRRLARLFDYRHRVTAQDLAAHARAGDQKMKILVSGSSGLIGTALVPFLTTGGHEVVHLVRAGGGQPGASVQWDPSAGTIDKAG